jgi:hypothetical protein
MQNTPLWVSIKRCWTDYAPDIMAAARIFPLPACSVLTLQTICHSLAKALETRFSPFANIAEVYWNRHPMSGHATAIGQEPALLSDSTPFAARYGVPPAQVARASRH